MTSTTTTTTASGEGVFPVRRYAPEALLITDRADLAAAVTALHPGVVVTSEDPTLPVGHHLRTPDGYGLLLLVPAATDLLSAVGQGRLYLIGTDLDDAGVWALAVRARVEKIVILPDGAPWLADQLARHLPT